MIIETFRQALQNVWSNKLRTFLTMLGIIIGVMAVIVIVGLGNGMTQSMRDSFSALGTNALSIQVWGYGSRTASVEDVYKIADKNKELISAVSPQIDFSNNTPKVGTTTYRYGTSVYGVDEHYAEMKNYTLAQGRGLQYMDIKDNKQVCIIGDYLSRAAYGGNAVGQTIKLGAYKFRIVGVLNAKVTDKNLQQGSDDDCIYLPYTTAMRLSIQSSEGYLHRLMLPEELKDMPFDKTLSKKITKFLKKQDPKMIFIYGQNDPWTAAGVTWLKNKKNIHVFIQPNGSHLARISTLPEAEKAEVMELINEWLK